jgi:pimeloyl-ACP methyl ester carboxylesterase
MSIAALVTILLLAQAVGAIPESSTPGRGYEDRFVNNEGRRVHYLDWGSAGKTPFVMLHGIARSAHSYDHIAPQFQHDYHVIAMDLRGHGDSDWHPTAAYWIRHETKRLENGRVVRKYDPAVTKGFVPTEL